MKYREFELWIGAQGTGKTFQLMRRIEFYSRRSSIKSVFIMDSSGEYVAEAEQKGWLVCHDIADLHHYLRENEEYPHAVVFDGDGSEEALEMFDRVFEWGNLEGDLCFVIDEAAEVVPGGSGRWPSSRHLKKMVTAGRHIRNEAGRMTKQHLIFAVQYPKDVHHALRTHAKTVLCFQVEGELSKNWIRENFSEEKMQKNSQLKQYQYQVLRGRLLTH